MGRSKKKSKSELIDAAIEEIHQALDMAATITMIYSSKDLGYRFVDMTEHMERSVTILEEALGVYNIDGGDPTPFDDPQMELDFTREFYSDIPDPEEELD